MQIAGPPDHPNDRDLRAFSSCSFTQGGHEPTQARDDVGGCRRKDGLRAKQSVQASRSGFWEFDRRIRKPRGSGPTGTKRYGTLHSI